MHVILFNFSWMTLNVFLALVAVSFGWIFYHSKNTFLKVISLFLWLIFLPNTAYLFTDLINLIIQWGKADILQKSVFIFQYAVIEIAGLLTFILSMYPFEKLLLTHKKIWKNHVTILIIIFNFIVGFGITLGRIERINSWDVLTVPEKVVTSSLKIFYTPSLILAFILFSLLTNFLYFLFRKPVLNFVNTYLIRVGA